MEKITTDTILDFITEKAADKALNFDTQWWMDTGLKLTILLGEEHAKLFDLQQKKAQKQLELRAESGSVSEAKLKLEATDEYRDYQKQKAKITQVEELIRVVKLQARVSQGI